MKNLFYIVVLSILSAQTIAACSDSDDALPPLFDEIDCSVISGFLSDEFGALYAPYAQEIDSLPEAGSSILPVVAGCLLAETSVSSSVEEQSSSSMRAKRQRSTPAESSSSLEIASLECNKCGKIFSTESNVKRHIKTVHEEGRYQCSFCKKIYPKEDSLQRHIKSVHEEIRHLCPFCDQSFSQKGHLSAHIKSIHGGIKHQCPSCDKNYNDVTRLNRHIKMIHNTEHQCSSCNETFTDKRNLTCHMKRLHREIYLARKRQRPGRPDGNQNSAGAELLLLAEEVTDFYNFDKKQE